MPYMLDTKDSDAIYKCYIQQILMPYMLYKADSDAIFAIYWCHIKQILLPHGLYKADSEIPKLRNGGWPCTALRAQYGQAPCGLRQ